MMEEEAKQEEKRRALQSVALRGHFFIDINNESTHNRWNRVIWHKFGYSSANEAKEAVNDYIGRSPGTLFRIIDSAGAVVETNGVSLPRPPALRREINVTTSSIRTERIAQMEDNDFDIETANDDNILGSKWIPVKSSAIKAVAYYEPLGMLEFKLNDDKEYSFRDVPKNEFDALMVAESKGKWFTEFVRRYRASKKSSTDKTIVASKWGKAGSGVLYYCQEDKTVLLLKRSQEVEDPEVWGIPGGAIKGTEGMYDDEELNIKEFNENDVRSSANAETEEELGHIPEHIEELGKVTTMSGNFAYTTFIMAVTQEQKQAISKNAQLNWESSELGWFPMSNLPKKTHPGVTEAIGRFFQGKSK